MTQLHYLFTDGCGGVVHCHAYRAHICLLMFCAVTQQSATFWGVGTHGWAYNPQIRIRQDFCTMHLTAKFHHPKFNHSEVIALTNKQSDKQMPLETSTSLRYATHLGNNEIIQKLQWTTECFFWNIM